MAVLKHNAWQENGTLFPRAATFQLVRLDEKDARRITDDVRTLRALITSCEDMYPSIGKWFDAKVMSGLRMSERVAFVAFESGKPVASAVVKRGVRSKFCHLRIADNFQDLALGQMLFTQMTLEAKQLGKEIHFTLPESLWYARQYFFEGFGFQCVGRAGRQYRPGNTELCCSAPVDVVWAAAMEKLPQLMRKFMPGGFSLDSRILISIRPKYLERIMAGSKVVEIRRRFSNRWLGCRAVLYGSHPLKALLGEATIRSITRGSPGEIWSRYGAEIGSDYAGFEAYTNGCSEVSAIELRDVRPYGRPIETERLSQLTGTNLRPPMSFCDVGLSGSNSWSSALAVVGLLHGRLEAAAPQSLEPQNIASDAGSILQFAQR